MTIERLNENAYISYPIAEDTVMKSNNGTEIPDSLLLDISIDLRIKPDTEVKLYALDIFSGYLVAYFSVISGGNTHSWNVTVPATLQDWYVVRNVNPAIWSAVMTFGEGVTGLCADHSGETLEMDFPIEPGRITDTTGHMLESISAPGGDVLNGDVKFVEGHNVSVSLIQETNTLVLSAQRNAGEGMPCSQSDAQAGDCGSSLYHINGLRPDWHGNMSLQGGPGITVTSDPANNKIVIKGTAAACKAGCENG